jgi:hypothetical protein
LDSTTAHPRICGGQSFGRANFCENTNVEFCDKVGVIHCHSPIGDLPFSLALL